MSVIDDDKTIKTNKKEIDILLSKLDSAIDYMNNGKIQTISDAWDEIDEV